MPFVVVRYFVAWRDPNQNEGIEAASPPERTTASVSRSGTRLAIICLDQVHDELTRPPANGGQCIVQWSTTHPSNPLPADCSARTDTDRDMIKTVKRVLPIITFIILAAGAVGLWVQSFRMDVLIGGLSTAVVIGLLFYVVINWDDALEYKKKETRQLADVVNHAMDAVVICDVAGQVLYVNAAARRAYGIDDRMAHAEQFEAIGLSEDRMAKVIDEVMCGQPWNGELSVPDNGEGQRVHLVSLFRLDEFRGHAPALVSIGRDLTQWKELEQKLRHSQKLAAVGELAAGVAHEINNPMASIQSQIGLARDLITLSNPAGPQPEGCGSNEKEILSCLDDVGKQVQRCSRIVESLLRFSRPSEPYLVEIDLNQVVQEAIQFTRSLPKMKSIEVSFEPGADLPAVLSDPHGIQQILVNLLVNAADAMQPPVGLRHRGEISIATGRSGADQVVVRVTDSGSGIDPKHIERVFEPFFTTKPPDEGTGLGLSISYGIAQSLGGALELHPQPQGGTCATLTLSVASLNEGADSPIATPEPRAEAACFSFRNPKSAIRNPQSTILRPFPRRVQGEPM
ncbi:MAG: PAS domain-containing protein [Planctomycetes bacterium]|nr:PAS domain-containing protein [Planctomycetota bacterium]